MTEPVPDTPSLATEYALALQERLASAHEVARRHLGKAAELPKGNYDKRVSSKPFRVVDSVWLHNIRRKKGRNPKLVPNWSNLSLGRPFLSGVCAIRCDASNPEKSKSKA